MELRWTGLSRRLRGRRILGLRYDARAGFAIIELEDGELWVSADHNGCQVFENSSRGKSGRSHGTV